METLEPWARLPAEGFQFHESMEDTYMHFGPNLRKIQAWPTHLSPQPAADEDSTSPAELYACAVPTLLCWKGRPLESTLGLCHARHDPKSCSQIL